MVEDYIVNTCLRLYTRLSVHKFQIVRTYGANEEMGRAGFPLWPKYFYPYDKSWHGIISALDSTKNV